MKPPRPTQSSEPAPRQGYQWLAVLGIYLAVALSAFWKIFSVGFGQALPPHSVDAYQEVWFLAWLPHALGTGSDPFFSSAIFAPHGVNLLTNASIPALGIVLSPLTTLFGPVTSFEVACIAAPTLSAFTAYLAARRFVDRAGLAVAAGFCFGLGPFLRTDLQSGHLHLTFLALLPLMLMVLHDIVRSEEGSQLPRGLLLGMLIVVQFFISAEILVIAMVLSVVGLVALAVSDRRSASLLCRRVWPGLTAALALVVVCLCYPAWYALDGPRHIAGPVWPHMARLSATAAAAVLPHAERPGVGFISRGNGDYLGVGLLAVVIVGAVTLSRVRTVRFFVFLAVVAEILALGYRLHLGHSSTGVPLPGWLFSRLPVLDSVVMSRFGAVLDLFVGILLAIVLDRFFVAFARWSRGPGKPGFWAVASVTAVAAIALVPLVFEPVGWTFKEGAAAPVPAALRKSIAGTRSAPVVLGYPDTAFGAVQQMVWQAGTGYHFVEREGYAIVPGRHHSSESLPSGATNLVFAAALLHELRLPLSPSADRALRDSLLRSHAQVVLVDLGASGGRLLQEALRPLLGPPHRVGGYDWWRLPGS